MKKWKLKNKKADIEKLSRTLKLSKPFCNLLVNRGFSTPETIRNYLEAQKLPLHDAKELKDCDKACQVIENHIEQGNKIWIIGDYDVDGIISTYILKQSLSVLSDRVTYYIPDRMEDGYGINENIIDAALSDGASLIVTCDNGISALEALAYAKEKDLDVVVTDHHEPVTQKSSNGEELCLPSADAIVNPKQADCGYPFNKICGATVAFKVVERLFQRLKRENPIKEELVGLVAVATVCDVVDLIDENRVIVKQGLEKLASKPNPGLQMLMKATGIDSKELTSFHLGFVIGPCLNAAGRIETAEKSLKLLEAQSPELAEEYAKELVELNSIRKDMTKEGTGRIDALVKEQLAEDPVIVAHDPSIHESIAGIIAGRIKEKYHRPTLVLTGEKEKVKGSGRSIEEYDLYREMADFRELYEKFGGHPMAVGLSMREENILPLRKALNERRNGEKFPSSRSLDLFLPLRFATRSLIDELHQLEPFGKGNEKPVFGAKDVRLVNGKVVGKQKNVLIITLKDELGHYFKGVLFGYDEQFDQTVIAKFGQQIKEDFMINGTDQLMMDLAYYPSVNRFNGKESVQIIIEDYK